MTVVGAVDDQGILQSPGSSSGAEKKKKDKKTTLEKPKSSKSSDKPSKSVETRPSRSSADDRIDELDKKWADHFNRLEALLFSKSLDQPEPTFQAPKVAPTHSPPVGAVKASVPFIRPSTDQPASSDLPGTGQPIPQGQPTSKSTPVVKQKRSSTADLPSTAPLFFKEAGYQQIDLGKDLSVSSMDTDSDSDFSDRPPVDIFVEECELSDQDPDATTDPDQTLSEDQTYRET